MDELRVGMKVAISSHNGGWGSPKPYNIVTVEKVTDTQVTLSNGKRYLKRNGDEIGGGNYGSYIARSGLYDQWLSVEEAERRNVEIEAQNERQRKAYKVKQFARWDRLTTEELDQVLAVISIYMQS